MDIVYCVFPNVEIANELAKRAVLKGLVACANVLPQTQSYFKWEGKISEAQETPVLFKTSASKVSLFVSWLEETHPYDVPCILTFEPSNANLAFETWVNSVVLEKGE